MYVTRVCALKEQLATAFSGEPVTSTELARPLLTPALPLGSV